MKAIELLDLLNRFSKEELSMIDLAISDTGGMSKIKCVSMEYIEVPKTKNPCCPDTKTNHYIVVKSNKEKKE